MRSLVRRLDQKAGSEEGPDQVDDDGIGRIGVGHDRDQRPLVQRRARMRQAEPYDVAGAEVARPEVAGARIGAGGEVQEGVLVIERAYGCPGWDGDASNSLR